MIGKEEVAESPVAHGHSDSSYNAHECSYNIQTSNYYDVLNNSNNNESPLNLSDLPDTCLKHKEYCKSSKSTRVKTKHHVNIVLRTVLKMSLNLAISLCN